MKEISQAFLAAQSQFAPAIKNSLNPHLRSKYADLSACIEAVIDALHANGISLMQKTHPWEGGVAIETIFMHESGQTLSGGVLNVPSTKQDPQGFGSAITYARRYSLMAACGIAPEDDDGEKASQPPPANKPKAVRAAKSVDELRAALDLADTAENLAIMWNALLPAEKDLVRDFVTEKGKKLKETKNV